NMATGTNSNTQLAASAVNRTGRSTALVRGDKLGAGSGNGFANFSVATPPALVGGGGAAGSHHSSILPWLVGTNLSGGSLSSPNNSLITYGPNGFRPLEVASEYLHTLAGATANDNVRLDGATTTFAGSVTVNALSLSSSPVVGGGTITVNSG